jgi:hypothetical protein
VSRSAATGARSAPVARRAAGAALLVGLALGSASPAAGGRGEEIPTGHPIYALLRRLEVASGLLPIDTRAEPLTRGEVLDALAEAERRGPVPRADSAWVARLRAEIREECALEVAAAADSGRVPLTARVGLRSSAEVDRGGHSRLRETLRVEAATDLTRHLALFESFEIDTHGDRDSDFSGRKWRDAVTGRIDRAGVRLAAERAALLVGRTAGRWGAGEPGGLAFSPESPPLDLVRATFDLGPARLTSLAASLDPYDTPATPTSPSATEQRRFAAHRLALRFAPTLGIGVTETVVYGGVDRGFELGYLLPIVSYYAEQWNESWNDNIFWSIDATWTPRPGLLFEGEFLVDDFQYDLETEPHQVGWTARGAWAPRSVARGLILFGEATRVESYVYGHSEPRNRYLHEDVLLGHPLGPDADAIQAGATWDASENTTLALALAHERHGAQRPETPQSATNPGNLGFPTPPVQARTRVEISGSWRPRVTRRLEGAIAYEDDEGTGVGWSGRLALTLRVDRRAAVAP